MAPTFTYLGASYDYGGWELGWYGAGSGWQYGWRYESGWDYGWYQASLGWVWAYSTWGWGWWLDHVWSFGWFYHTGRCSPAICHRPSLKHPPTRSNTSHNGRISDIDTRDDVCLGH